LWIWDVKTGAQVCGFTQKSNEGWLVQWTDDEGFCAKQIGSEVHFFDTTKFDKGAISRIKLEGLQSFSISPGKRPVVGVFVAGKNQGPSSAKIFDISNLAVPLSQKSFFRADSVTFHWNALGTNVLVFTHTDVDVTGQSYYGETSLYFLSITGSFDCRVDLNHPGPIHDVTWAPNSKEFIVVYGSMPAKATLFDHRASPIYELGSAPRNTVKYSPSGRFFFIAGFGNLQGEIDVWERKGFKKSAIINGSNSSLCEWSPDGRYLMTAILYKRLKVDNGLKIWHYSGALVHQMNQKELLQVAWRPEDASLWPERSGNSPVPEPLKTVETPKKPTGKYVPPGARGSQITTTYVFVINKGSRSN
jgi:translation initiation factor 2A